MLTNTKFGFTLSEVLVTLGIIGVVSAMTVPTLMRNHQRQVFVTQLKKSYSTISQVAENILFDYNAVTLHETPYGSGKLSALSFLKNYFKVSNECTTSRTPCMGESYKYVNGSSFTGWDFGVEATKPCVTTADGTGICLSIWTNRGYDYMNSFAYLYIDVNGQQGPNIVGRDLFFLVIHPDGSVGDSTVLTDKADDYIVEGCIGNEGWRYGFGCLEVIIRNGWQMDY